MDSEDNSFYAYEVQPGTDMPISPAPAERTWMDESDRRFAYRCLPLVIANQAGWFLPNPSSFIAVWDGGLSKESVRIWFESPGHTQGTVPSNAVARLADHQSLRQWDCHHRHSLPVPDASIRRTLGQGADQHLQGRRPGPGRDHRDRLAARHVHHELEADPPPASPSTSRKASRSVWSCPCLEASPRASSPVRLPIAADPELQAQHRDWAESRKQFIDDLQQEGTEAVRRGGSWPWSRSGSRRDSTSSRRSSWSERWPWSWQSRCSACCWPSSRRNASCPRSRFARGSSRSSGPILPRESGLWRPSGCWILTGRSGESARTPLVEAEAAPSCPTTRAVILRKPRTWNPCGAPERSDGDRFVARDDPPLARVPPSRRISRRVVTGVSSLRRRRPGRLSRPFPGTGRPDPVDDHNHHG